MGWWTLLCVTVLLYNITGGVCAHLRNSIVGGKDAHKGAWPWMVYLQMDIDSNSATMCGGSLVSNQWIMTAAHCWKETYNLQNSFARVGALSLKEPSGRQVKLKKVVPHPQFTIDGNRQMYFNDIALVQLQEQVSFSATVKTVTLPTTSPRDLFSPKSECWVTGWGKVAENESLGGKQTLQEVQLSLVDDVTCRKLYPHKTDRQLCAGDLEGGKDSCQGDSGGPLVCVPSGEKQGKFVQVGIVSSGRGCGRKGEAGFYTRVSSYIQFINDTIKTN